MYIFNSHFVLFISGYFVEIVAAYPPVIRVGSLSGTFLKYTPKMERRNHTPS